MQFSNGQFQPDTSLGYYVAKPNLFPTIPGVYDYLTSINLSPVNGYTPPSYTTSPGGGSGSSPNTKPSLPSWSINRPPIRASLIRVRVRHGIRVSPPNIPPSCKSSLSSPTEPLPHRRPSKSEKAKALPGPYFIPEPGPASEATPITTTNTSLVMASY